ncbi:MAG TPA: hypothetical protein VH105_25815 [Burkholderiales bacterium]|jgi:hypothetical protein|nr:hypothetical protein [Burkholderiales bacterium]
MQGPILFGLVLAAALLLSRSARRSRFLRSETRTVNLAFLATKSEDLAFRGDRATIIYDEMRADRWAPGKFLAMEYECPVSAIRVAHTPERKYYLWTFSTTLQPVATAIRIDAKNNDEALRGCRKLMSRTFPYSKISRPAAIAGTTLVLLAIFGFVALLAWLAYMLLRMQA